MLDKDLRLSLRSFKRKRNQLTLDAFADKYLPGSLVLTTRLPLLSFLSHCRYSCAINLIVLVEEPSDRMMGSELYIFFR